MIVVNCSKKIYSIIIVNYYFIYSQAELGVASTSEVIENHNDPVLATNYREQSKDYEIQIFRLAEDTTTWSSVAVARTNVNLPSKRINNNNINHNNNLSVSRLSLSSSAESLSDYEGAFN